MNNIKNIIFDYGNVIFSLDFSRSRQAWNDLGIDNADTFYGHKVQDKIFDGFERGEVAADEFRDYIRKIANHPNLADQQINDAWNSLLVGVPKGNHELLLSLKPKIQNFFIEQY